MRLGQIFALLIAFSSPLFVTASSGVPSKKESARKHYFKSVKTEGKGWSITLGPPPNYLAFINKKELGIKRSGETIELQDNDSLELVDRHYRLELKKASGGIRIRQSHLPPGSDQEEISEWVEQNH